MDLYILILGLGVLIILSYFFEQVGKLLRIPSVVLLLLAGIGLKQFVIYMGINAPNIVIILPFIGTIALLLIVLEGALDLHLQKDKAPIIFKAFSSALLGILVISFFVAFLFWLIWKTPFYSALLNAIPFAVISSAVAIPSTFSLDKANREFIIYESTFSDILGILFFNFLAEHEEITFHQSILFGLIFISTVILSAFISVFLILYLNKIKHHVKFLPIFALLLIIYSMAKIYHFSPLVIILIFGLMLNNSDLFVKGKLANYFNMKDLRGDIVHFRSITIEAVFLVRTFFFILFGYSIQLMSLIDGQSVLVALLVFGVIFIFRLARLAILNPSNAKVLVFFAPRGLITLLLFLSIPTSHQVTYVNQGSVIWLVLISILLMIVGLWTYKIPFEENESDYVIGLQQREVDDME
jgi:NhaP-type Na+/H+ or K+/H+ antiporter